MSIVMTGKEVAELFGGPKKVGIEIAIREADNEGFVVVFTSHDVKSQILTFRNAEGMIGKLNELICEVLAGGHPKNVGELTPEEIKALEKEDS